MILVSQSPKMRHKVSSDWPTWGPEHVLRKPWSQALRTGWALCPPHTHVCARATHAHTHMHTGIHECTHTHGGTHKSMYAHTRAPRRQHTARRRTTGTVRHGGPCSAPVAPSLHQQRFVCSFCKSPATLPWVSY